jgi:hypothetical protein
MSTLRSCSIVLAMSLTIGVASAEEFDGSQPLECTATKGHDCLPTESKCNRLKPESNTPPVFLIDAAKKEVHSPFRTTVLPVLYTNTGEQSLVLQGADQHVSWTAAINKKTGAMTVAIADRKGAYVVFGQCKVAATK